MKRKYKQCLCMFLIVMLIAVQFTVPQLVSAEKQYVKQLIYSENFNNVSNQTLSFWGGSYSASAAAGQWFFEGNTPVLVQNGSASDKCLAIQPHTKGTDDYVYFTLPEAITSGGLYTITFDYYHAGSWCDWFYLVGKNSTLASNSMGYTGNNWIPIEMTIDTTNKTWTIKSSTSVYTLPSSSTNSLFNNLPISAMIFRIHKSAATGTQVKFDNFKVYKTVENPDYNIDDDKVVLKDKWNNVQTDLDAVDIKLGSIDIDFGNVGLDETTITEDNILLEGGVSYQIRYEDNILKIMITSSRLDYDNSYTLTLDGLKTSEGKTVTKKVVTFTTLENKPQISDGEYIENEDFEDWTNTTCAEHYTDAYITLGGFRTWTALGIVSGKDGGKALTAMNGSTQASRGLQYYFIPKLEKDLYTVDYDYYTGDIDNFSGMKLGVYRNKDGYGMNLIPFEGMTALGSKTWGHVKIEFITSTGAWNVKITDDAEEVVFENSGTWSDSTVNLLEWVFDSKNASLNLVDANVPKIDNFVVNAIYSSEQKLSQNSITIYDGENLQEFDSVSPSSNKIIVDFGQRMMPEDMNKDNIYITEVGSNAPILTTDRYSNGKYELSPVDYLLSGKTYSIYINACQNVSGIKMSKNYKFDFTVGEGAISAELLKLMKNSSQINSISKLTPGNVKLQVLYNNSTGDDYTLYYILAFYKGNELIYSKYDTENLGGYADSQIKEVDLSIPELAKEYDEVNIIAWDSFNGMLPVSKSLVLK